MGTILKYGGCGTRMDRDRRSDRVLLGAMRCGKGVLPKMAMASRWVRFFYEKNVKKSLFKNIYFIASHLVHFKVRHQVPDLTITSFFF